MESNVKLRYLAVLAALVFPASLVANDVKPRINERFAATETEEAPDFQRHIIPLMGRLGCNGRACHGSFQGRGGFRLSLFGYDFKSDHEALTEGEYPRVDVNEPAESLILNKPTDADNHEGGLRYEKGSWQYHVFRRWIDTGAKYDSDHQQKLAGLEIEPAEILFGDTGDDVQLKAIAVWDDGSREDVTPLCRFRSNDEQVAKIDETGHVVAAESGDTHLVVFYDIAVVPVPVIQPVTDLIGDKYPIVATPTEIDELVVTKLRKLGVIPSDVGSDEEFLRRLSLDLTGSLPSAVEAAAFFADPSPGKRQRKIEELLERPSYAAWWTTKLCDYTGNNATELVNSSAIRGRAEQEWYDWIYKRIANNTPYDEIVEGIVLATSRKPDQTFTDYCSELSELYRGETEETFAEREYMPHWWSRRNFRQPEEKAIGFAYTFMGIRIQCAKCHKHPFDQWSKSDFEQFTKFFTRVTSSNRNNSSPQARDEYNKIVESLGLTELRGNQRSREYPKMLEEGKTIPFPEVYVTRAKKGDTAKLLGSDVVTLADYDDVREPIMDWLRGAGSQYFARAMVNRVWANYFNVGIVEPPDDLSLANPPSNKPLLDYLTDGFIASGYDLKWLHRTIISSDTYQRSWHPNETNRMDEKNFSRSVHRRMPAEVAYDAVIAATASDEQVAHLQQEVSEKTIAIAASNSRNRRGPGYALTIFGRSTRESNCDCDRSSEASLLQTVFLQNDAEVLNMIDRKGTGWLDQVASEIRAGQGLAATTDAQRSKRLANLQRQAANLKKQLKRLANAEGPQQVARRKQVEQRLTEVTQRLDALQPARAEVETPAVDYDAIVQQAYLRTLGRYPNPQELDTARTYIDQSDDSVNGVRGVLWALLNTKEFIVNH